MRATSIHQQLTWASQMHNRIHFGEGKNVAEMRHADLVAWIVLKGEKLPGASLGRMAAMIRSVPGYCSRFEET